MTDRRPLLLSLILIILAVAAGIVWYFNQSPVQNSTTAPDSHKNQSSTNAPRPAMAVTVEKPQRQLLPNQLATSGNIAAWQEMSIGSDVNGLRLAEVRVDVGDTVQKGQILATFDTSLIQADRAQARAGLAEAEAALIDASGNADRARTISPSGALSRQQVNQYLTAEKTARARVAAAQAMVESQDLRLKQTQVLAPDAGVISSRNVTLGMVVGAGTELFRLLRRGRLEWRAEVTSQDLGRLKPGMKAEVTLPGGRDLQGTLRQIAPTVDPKTRYALAYVDLPAGSAARAGMFAQGRFQLSQEDALTLPQEALVMRDGFAHVLRVGTDQRVTLVRVQTGRMVDNRIEVTEGIAPDELFAVQGAAFLNEGDLVQVTP